MSSGNTGRDPFLLRKSGIAIQSTFRQFFWTWLLVILTIAWIIFTIFFAYNASLTQPKRTALLFSEPQYTILTLTILSHGTVLMLAALAETASEGLRWVYACSSSGVSAYSFLTLSRATGILGVLNLWLEKGTKGCGSRNGHYIWSFQRFCLIFTPSLASGLPSS